eukprot:8278901-Pyramimonas_sp.AAC.1
MCACRQNPPSQHERAARTFVGEASLRPPELHNHVLCEAQRRWGISYTAARLCSRQQNKFCEAPTRRNSMRSLRAIEREWIVQYCLKKRYPHGGRERSGCRRK